MLNELVTTFILKSWRDLEQQILPAQTYIESLHSMESDLQTTQFLLCSFEKKGLLAFDQRWVAVDKLEVPKACLAGHEPVVYKKVRVRSSSISLVDSMNPWDHRIEIRVGDEKPYALYLRQDKKYVGAHSTKGWSAWIERKKGGFRFEYVNTKNNTHLRVQGSGKLHPIKGDLQRLESLEALHVSGSSDSLRATIIKLSGAK